MCECAHEGVAHVFAREWVYIFLVRGVCMGVTGMDMFVCLLSLGT